MTHSLLFDDSIELIDPDGVISEGPYWFEALAGTSWGNPQPVEIILNSLMRDGMLTETESVGNREVNVALRIRASDPLGLQDGMDVLHRAVGKRTTLVWTPPDGYADARVYEVETSSLETGEGEWDLEYLRNEVRVRLRLVCQPYWRETDLTTEVAEGIPSVGTIVNPGTSTAGWSAPAPSPSAAGMVAVDEDAVATKAWKVEEARFVGGLGGQDARRVVNSSTLTQSINIPSGAYLSFEVKFDVPIGRTLTSYYGETYQETGTLDTFAITAGSKSRTYKKVRTQGRDDWLFSQGIVEALADGWTRYTFRIDEAMSISALTWDGAQLVPFTDSLADAARPRIKVRRVAVAESAVLGKQVLKTIDVGGSARTVGALHVAAPSDSVALSQVLAFTIPQSKVATGFRPDLSQWVKPGAFTDTVGGRTVLSGVASGYGALGSPVFEAPVSLFKSGAYTVAAPFFSVNPGQRDLMLETAVLVGGVVAQSQETLLSWTVSASDASRWRMYVLATAYLPPVAMQSPRADATVRFRFKAATTSVSAIDEVYVFPTEGDLTIIDCGSGAVGPAASSHLWIDSPSPEQPQGGYWRGATPTRDNAVSAWSTTVVPGVHSFDPGAMLAFVASSEAQGPTVSFDYHKRRP